MADNALDLWALTGARSDLAAPPIDAGSWRTPPVAYATQPASVRPRGLFASAARVTDEAAHVPPAEEDALEAPRNIVVALDSSPGAANVLSSALRTLQGTPSAVLHVVHVFRTSRIDHARVGVPSTPAVVIEEAREDNLEARVREARLRSQRHVVGHFAVGDPAKEVLRLCRELKADLLVVGTHDSRGLERWLLGSIAETFVRKASCPVLVVRSSRHAA